MNKDDIRIHFEDGDIPTGAEFSEWIERCLIWIDREDELPEADGSIEGSCYLVGGTKVYRCEYTGGMWQWVPKTGDGGGTYSYLDLTNKPRLNGVVISGSKRPSEFGLMPDFTGVKETKVLKDNYRIIVGIERNEVRYTTVASLRAYLGATEGTVQSAARTVIPLKGAQDGENAEFAAETEYLEGTGALYLNGLRQCPGRDYEEREAGVIVLLGFPPKEDDRLLFEAVPVYSDDGGICDSGNGTRTGAAEGQDEK